MINIRNSKYFGIFAIQILEIVQRYAFLSGQMTNGRGFEVIQIVNHSKQKLFKIGPVVRYFVERQVVLRFYAYLCPL